MHTFSEIGTDIIFILLHFLIYIINYRLLKKTFHPAVLFSFTWFAIITLHFILKLTLLNELFPLGIQTYLIFFIGVLSFSIGSFIATLHFSDKNFSRQAFYRNNEISFSFSIRYFLLAIVLIGLPFYIRASFQIFLQSQAEDFLKGLRGEISFNDADVGPTKYLITLSFIVFAINLYYYFTGANKLKNAVLLFLSIIAAFTYSFFFTGRTLFLMLFTLYVGISYIKNPRFSIKKIIALGMVFILAFTAIGLFWYDKGGNENENFKANLKTSAQETGIYFVSSLSAFDGQVKEGIRPDFTGESSLRFFVKVFQEYNIVSNKNVKSLVQEYSFVPYPTNVYTYYYPYLKDFGYIYAWFLLLIFGFWHTILYLKAVKFRNIKHTLYFAFSLYPLIMSFFQDQYMSLFSFWIQIFMYTELCLLFNRIFSSTRLKLHLLDFFNS